MSIDIRLSVDFWQHPKTRMLQKRLTLRGVRSLQILWCWAAQRRPNGSFEGMTTEAIALAADWVGNEDKFVGALVECGFLDFDGTAYTLHDWQENNAWAAASESRGDAARLSRLGRSVPSAYSQLTQLGIKGITKEEYSAIVNATGDDERTAIILAIANERGIDIDAVNNATNTNPNDRTTNFSDQNTTLNNADTTVENRTTTVNTNPNDRTTNRTTPSPAPSPTPTNVNENTERQKGSSSEPAQAPTPEPQPVVTNPIPDPQIPEKPESPEATEQPKNFTQPESSVTRNVTSNVTDNVTPMEPAIMILPCTKHQQFPVTASMVAHWSELYPAVDVLQALRSMLGWLESNPSKIKTLGGTPKFINTWLSKEQDRGGNRNRPQNANPNPNSGGSYFQQARAQSAARTAAMVDGRLNEYLNNTPPAGYTGDYSGNAAGLNRDISTAMLGSGVQSSVWGVDVSGQ